MAIGRLTENIKLDRGEKFILLYGNINDEFCDNDLVIGNIDFMLWRYFQCQGYQRIVFFQGSKMIYFFDQESLRLCLPEQKIPVIKPESVPELTSGPLGDLMLLDEEPGKEEIQLQTFSLINETNQEISPLRNQRSMSYFGALQILDTIMLENIPTVVIFINSEELSPPNFGKEAFNLFQSQLKDWAQMPVRTLNKCVFIFQTPQIEKIKEVIDNNRLSFLLNYIWFKEKADKNNIIEIGFPDTGEINNLIHHFRLLHNLKVDWEILEKLIEFLAKQDINLRNWYVKLRTFDKNSVLNKEILLKWNDEHFMKNSTHFLIENLGKKFSISDLTGNLSQVHCQEDSIPQIVESLELWFPIKQKKKPLSLFFVGTSGVGKTFTVKLLAESLKSIGYDYCSFRMTEYQEKESVSNLIGSPTGYIGSEEEPKLFQALRKAKNKLVILFDEIEKAHPNILKALMQLLEEGSLSWSKGEGDFRNCILCFTSNAQMKRVVDEKSKWINMGHKSDELEFQNSIRDILFESGIAPEICRRIGLFLVYNPLNPQSIMKIALQEIDILAKEYELDVLYTAPEFLADIAKRAAGSIYGVGSFHGYLSGKIGNLLVNYQKQFPQFNQVIIIKNDNALEVLHAEKNINYDKANSLIKASDIYNLDTKKLNFLNLENIVNNLSQVHCQEDSIPQIVESLELWFPIKQKKKPLSLFFVGTSGVGKTFTVKLLAESLKSIGYDYCSFRMTEYQEKESVSNLIGSPTGYIGSEEEPKLFQALRKAKNKLVILFDEIEKAHPNILKALMQLLEEGSLSWSKGEGDFRNCILCFTSNAQMKRVVDEKSKWINMGHKSDELEFQNSIRDILFESGIAPEICRRIGLFLVYNPLNPQSIMKIALQEIDILAKEYELDVLYTAPEFLADIAKRAAGSIYGVGSFHGYLSGKIGNLLVNYQKQFPQFNQVIIIKNDNALEVLHAEKNINYDKANSLIKASDIYNLDII